MTIASKLSYLNDTKKAIKDALINKGVEVSDTDTFRSYADKISEISGKIAPTYTPMNIAGLDYILDGEFNLPTGSNHSNMNVYNLIKPAYSNNTKGQSDITNGVSSFATKSFRPAGAIYTPNYNCNSWTWDFAIRFSEAPLSFIDYASLIHINGGAGTGGYSVHITPSTGALNFMASTSTATNSVKLSTNSVWNPNEICYISIVSTASTGATKLYHNGTEVTQYSVNQLAPYKICSATSNTGLFGSMSATTTSSSSNIPSSSSGMWAAGSFLFPNIDVYSVRHWNRVLSDDEIKANYEADYARFNF